jgi:hypothetical protein
MKYYQTLSKVFFPPPHLSNERFTPPCWKCEFFLHFVLIHPLASKVLFILRLLYTNCLQVKLRIRIFFISLSLFSSKSSPFCHYIPIGAKHPTLILLFATTLTVHLPGFVHIYVSKTIASSFLGYLSL